MVAFIFPAATAMTIPWMALTSFSLTPLSLATPR
jgi:hypothetical protein